MAPRIDRPLSPFMTYRWTLTMAMSIVHRITGIALYVGTLLMAWWLIATASGPGAYATLQAFTSSWIGRVVVFGYTWALLHHMLGGIRHLIWDIGALLDKDAATKLALATFIGSFLFSIVGLIVLKTGAYGARGRVVLFVITIAVIALVIVSLLRWIDHLTRLGRVGETTDRVEGATRQALKARLRDPCLGGRPLHDLIDDLPGETIPITAEVVGYIQHIDMPALSRLSEANDADIYVKALPGKFVYPHVPIAWITKPGNEVDIDTLREAVCNAFSIDDERSFDQDPRFGLAVMSEIASRALSPAMNDPGTAIDVIGRTTRLLSIWANGPAGDPEDEPTYPRVHVPPLDSADLLEDGFMVIARDGAGLIEVQLRIQKSLLALSRMGDSAFRTAALFQSRMAFDRAEAAMTLEADKVRLRELVRSRGNEPGVTVAFA